MKTSTYPQIMSIIALTISATATRTQPSHAQNNAKFFCGISRGVPVTFVRTPRGDQPIIRPVDKAFSPPRNPTERCTEIYSDTKDYDRAIADFNQALKLDPNDAIAYNERGLAYYHNKDYDRAIADFNQAIKLNPTFAIAYNNRGFAYYDLKDYDRAFADFNQAIKLNPSIPIVYQGRGLVYLDKKDYDRAIADFNQALKLDPKFARPYNGRGLVYLDKKDYDRAIADFNQALKLDPKFARPYNNRGGASSFGRNTFNVYLKHQTRPKICKRLHVWLWGGLA